jgi:hypothetical protein
MPARFVSLVAVASLLVAIVTSTLWLRSFWVDDALLCARPFWSLYFESADGELWAEFALVVDHKYPNSERWQHRTDKVDGSGVFPDRIPGEFLHFRGHGFAYVTGERWNDYHYALFMPFWCPVSALTLFPFLRCGYQSRNRKSLRGFEVGCHHKAERNATPSESGICSS